MVRLGICSVDVDSTLRSYLINTRRSLVLEKQQRSRGSRRISQVILMSIAAFQGTQWLCRARKRQTRCPMLEGMLVVAATGAFCSEGKASQRSVNASAVQYAYSLKSLSISSGVCRFPPSTATICTIEMMRRDRNLGGTSRLAREDLGRGKGEDVWADDRD